MKCNVTKTSIYPNFPTTQPSAPYSDDFIYERHLMSALFCGGGSIFYYCLDLTHGKRIGKQVESGEGIEIIKHNKVIEMIIKVTKSLLDHWLIPLQRDHVSFLARATEGTSLYV